MADEKQLKPLQARGKATRHSEVALNEMTSAEAMEKLVEGAAADFVENAPRPYKTLLETDKDQQ